MTSLESVDIILINLDNSLLLTKIILLAETSNLQNIVTSNIQFVTPRLPTLPTHLPPPITIDILPSASIPVSPNPSRAVSVATETSNKPSITTTATTAAAAGKRRKGSLTGTVKPIPKVKRKGRGKGKKQLALLDSETRSSSPAVVIVDAKGIDSGLLVNSRLSRPIKSRLASSMAPSLPSAPTPDHDAEEEQETDAPVEDDEEEFTPPVSKKRNVSAKSRKGKRVKVE